MRRKKKTEVPGAKRSGMGCPPFSWVHSSPGPPPSWGLQAGCVPVPGGSQPAECLCALSWLNKSSLARHLFGCKWLLTRLPSKRATRRKFNGSHLLQKGIPSWLGGEESACQCRRHRFSPWEGRSPEEGNGNPLQYDNPLAWEIPGQRSLVDYSPWDFKELDNWATDHPLRHLPKKTGQALLSTIFRGKLLLCPG